MRTLTKKNSNLWPLYIKNPLKDLSSYALIAILVSRLLDAKEKFQIERVVEINNYNYCPLTKVYLNHKSFNTGAETHFFYYDGNVVGSMVMNIADDQISNWRRKMLQARVIEYLNYSFNPIEVAYNKDPYLFNDNHSLKAGFSLYMEVEGEDYSMFVVNIYLDLSQEVGKIVFKL